jgi:hypothetical protein
MTPSQDRKRCREYYKNNADAIKARRRARYLARVIENNGTPRGPDHGLSKSPEYSRWCAMNTRCSNPRHPSYDRYGGRGISVCEGWKLSFPAFLRDVGPMPPGTSLDRIDNNKGYEPGNVRWATQKTQLNNRENNFKVIFEGEETTLTLLSERFGMNVYTLRDRLLSGESPESAVRRPVRKSKAPTILTKADVRKAKTMAKSGKSQREIAKHFRCDRSHVSRVLSGKVKRFA